MGKYRDQVLEKANRRRFSEFEGMSQRADVLFGMNQALSELSGLALRGGGMLRVLANLGWQDDRFMFFLTDGRAADANGIPGIGKVVVAWVDRAMDKYGIEIDGRTVYTTYKLDYLMEWLALELSPVIALDGTVEVLQPKELNLEEGFSSDDIETLVWCRHHHANIEFLEGDLVSVVVTHGLVTRQATLSSLAEAVAAIKPFVEGFDSCER